MKEYILFGTGWRAMFYVRIATHLTSLLRINAIYTRRKDFSLPGFYVTDNAEDALSKPHDAVIVASGRIGFLETMKYLGKRGETILTETSFLTLTEEELKEVEDIKGYTLEQYPHFPLFSAVIKATERIGKVDQLKLSSLHNHHASAILRAILKENSIPKDISAVDFPSSTIKTAGRGGRIKNGEREEYIRKIRIIRYPSNKLFIHDFSTNTYHSTLIRDKIEVRGERGIVDENGVRYVGKDGETIVMPFVFHRDTEFFASTMTLSHITLGSEVVFSNPFYPSPLSDDEIAVALLLQAFDKGCLEYSIQDGVLDVRIGRLL